jgi:hypothetical protein
MGQLFFNLLSGIIGVIVGALISVWINQVNRKDAAIGKMLSIVFPIGFKLHWSQDAEDPRWSATSQPSLKFHENYSHLWNAYAELRAALPFWKRKELEQAWQSYMNVKYFDQIPNDEPHKIFHKGTHSTRDAALTASSDFIRYLIELSDYGHLTGKPCKRIWSKKK